MSASSPLRANDPDQSLRQWLADQSERLYLPSVAIGEIRSGVESSRRRGQSLKADLLERWLSQLLTFFDDRILAIDARIADLSGLLFESARSKGEDPGWIDAQIAATARAHGLVLLTRNTRHFIAMEVEFRNPFAEDFDRLG